jgi:hypothetical protein
VTELPFAILAVYSSEALITGKPLLFILEITGGMVFMGAMLYVFHRRLGKRQIQFKDE